MAGFSVKSAVELDDLASKAHKKNFPHCKVIEEDITKVTGNMLLEAAEVEKGEVDVVIGGPPCQGFSLAGKRALDDVRNELLGDYARIVLEIMPKFFVMENVKGLLSYKSGKVLEDFIEQMTNHYLITLPVKILNAADFGVPQNRERLFVIGVRSDLNYIMRYPKPTHIKPSDARFQYSSLHKDHSSDVEGELHYCPTVADALSDLPNPNIYPKLIEGDSIVNKISGSYISEFAKEMRRIVVKDDDYSTPRPDWDKNLLTNTKRTKHEKGIYNEFLKLKEGEIHRSRRKKLNANGLSPTIRAGTKSDKGSYTALRPIHYKQPRVITVREGARLMSFPDWMDFHETKWHGFRLVGNAVPPLLAKAVAKEIIYALNQILKSQEEVIV